MTPAGLAYVEILDDEKASTCTAFCAGDRLVR